jgi:hypothetical protein
MAHYFSFSLRTLCLRALCVKFPIPHDGQTYTEVTEALKTQRWPEIRVSKLHYGFEPKDFLLVSRE